MSRRDRVLMWTQTGTVAGIVVMRRRSAVAGTLERWFVVSREDANAIVVAAQRMRRSRHAVKIALPTAAALGAGAAIAVGAIPSSDGTIQACYAGPSGMYVGDAFEAPGALRVIDPDLAGLPAGDAAIACQEG